MAITLPTKKSEVQNLWIDQKIGMIGAAGIGKSEFWSHGEKTLYLQTEAGLNHLEVMKVVIRDWEDFKEAYSALAKADPFPYDTIVIDTIDKMKDIVDEEVVKMGRQKYTKIDINTIGDIPNGAGWNWSTSMIENVLGKLEALPACIAYIGHLDMKEIKEPTRSIHKQTISIGGKTGSNLASWPDHFLNINAQYRGDVAVRTVRTKPSETIEAKSRGGIIPDGWKWEDDSKVNYAKLRAAFN